MLKRFFVTGTDTSVGKTVVSRALLQALAASGRTVAGYKPVAKGSKETPEGLRNKDAMVLQSVSSIELPYSAVNPVALSEDESSVAHSFPINYTLLSNGLAHLCDRVDHVVVEGTGGWRSLMNDLRPLSEWVVQEQMAVVMVVGIQEGCINHALLTAQAIASDGLPLIGWVANRINPGLAHYAEIINVLSRKLPAPLVGELPYLPRAEQRELAQYINLQMANGMLVADRILA
ncbi:dethiobiotin synthase [Phytobacter sp. V91]|uniref:dethiobiotin synthase n=1 Tax=Phytobacter sp. V91 TaxID=3369425 RepID=UPI003F60FE14